jgi:hypothetical protein
MVAYAKSSDSIIKVVDAKGKPHNVTRRAYDVVLSKQGYKLASDVEIKAIPKKPRSKKEDAKAVVLGE